MAGLRAKQRERRTRAIIAAAGDEFRRVGSTEAKIEDIAAKAEVAPATIYNYFGDKRGLLVALFQDHLSTSRALTAALAANPPRNPLKAIEQYFAAVFKEALRDLSRDLWCEAYAASYMGVKDGLGGIVDYADALLVSEMRQMFEVLQQREDLGSAIAAQDLAEFALAVGNLHWSRYLSGLVDLDTARLGSIRQIRILIRTANSEAKEKVRRLPTPKRHDTKRGND